MIWLGQTLPGLPSCYSGELDTCVGEFQAAQRENRPMRMPNCERWYPLWLNTPTEEWNRAIDAMTVCPEPTAAPKLKRNFWPLAAFALGGLFVGIMIR